MRIYYHARRLDAAMSISQSSFVGPFIMNRLIVRGTKHIISLDDLRDLIQKLELYLLIGADEITTEYKTADGLYIKINVDDASRILKLIKKTIRHLPNIPYMKVEI